jgi:hypothetical protein
MAFRHRMIPTLGIEHATFASGLFEYPIPLLL